MVVTDFFATFVNFASLYRGRYLCNLRHPIAFVLDGRGQSSRVVAMNERIVDILVGPEGDGVRLDAFLSGSRYTLQVVPAQSW